MSRFIDEVEIEVRSGDGGNGIVAWRREKFEPMGGPAGGNGGKGGDVIFEASEDLNTLLDFKYNRKYRAKDGSRGGPKGKHGRSAADLVIRVPVGTVIIDKESNEQIADLEAAGSSIMVAQGGRGGRGNATMATSTRRSPHYCEPGHPGVLRDLRLSLKLLADVGLVGLPNAGKSTLLASVTAARPKIADYPFTTITPNLGVVRQPSGDGFVIADIPGLVEGAATGVGLGHSFLKHLERTRVLVHLVDITSESPDKDMETIVKELGEYGERLKTLPRVIALSKSDLIAETDCRDVLEKTREKLGEVTVLAISAATGKGTAELTGLLAEMLAAMRGEEKERIAGKLQPDQAAFSKLSDSFEIVRHKNIFYIHGDRPERLVSVTNLKDPESLQHMYRVLRGMGVIDALLAEGIQQGQEVSIGGVAFSFGDDWS